MIKSKFKKQLWCHFSDVITITSPKNVTIFFSIWAPSNQNFWLRQWSVRRIIRRFSEDVLCNADMQADTVAIKCLYVMHDKPLRESEYMSWGTVETID